MTTKDEESSRTEDILVVYASQTGNCEQAAQQFCAKASERLEKKKNVNIVARYSTMDDFIEQKKCEWPRLVVVMTSSYGVGQAPLGGYRFRAFCDALLDETTTTTPPMLSSLTYAMLGLGDSMYTTFF
mmetsp:Transcript_32124/g.49102  ORF Transcript_32124/g.49102 Transcript_32124/m.49102 type:complete len:128 (-) Transcript_32124:12-395(-)